MGSNFDQPLEEVCFVAGTPILMANGTSKSIEEIESGDIVFAVDHEHQNSDPKPCRVAQVFHNTPQPTWKLTLADGQIIQCTKEHPFYVIGRSWISAEDLFIGDHLLRPDGSTIPLSAKEYVDAKQPVFNIEVENAHTYFVGKSIETAVLVHNVCPICGGDRIIQKNRNPVSVFFTNIGNIFDIFGVSNFSYEECIPCTCSPENSPEIYSNVNNLDHLGSVNAWSMSRAVMPQLKHNEILANEQIANYYNTIGDAIEGVQIQLAIAPVAMFRGAFVSKGGQLIIQNSKGSVICKITRFTMKYGDDVADVATILNSISQLLATNDIWSQGTFESPEQSFLYHYEKHGKEVGADSFESYLNKAKEFSSRLKGAYEVNLKKRGIVLKPTEGHVKHIRNGKFIIFDQHRKIVSFGKVW